MTAQTAEVGRHRAAETVPEPASFRRYQITPDGRWYRYPLAGPVVAAGTRHAGLIEFWAMHNGAAVPSERELAVFYDEQVLPPGVQHLHTVIAGRLVWHLVERVR